MYNARTRIDIIAEEIPAFNKIDPSEEVYPLPAICLFCSSACIKTSV